MAVAYNHIMAASENVQDVENTWLPFLPSKRAFRLAGIFMDSDEALYSTRVVWVRWMRHRC
jgi:hypothetical protein